MTSERIIWGPPGTGKTTAGITLARGWYDGGIPSTSIAYLAFTKDAAREAAVRIFEKDDDTALSEQFPLFRTIHSLCYRGLHRHKPDLRLINTGDMKQFSKVSGMDGTYSVFDWEDLADVYRKLEDQGRSEWDAALNAYLLSRITARSVADLEAARTEPSREAQKLLGIMNMKLDVYAAFVSQYERFKTADGLIDFTDMLEHGLREMPPLEGCRYVVTDEAQDLSPLLYAVIDRLFAYAEEMYWIGDDDQCQPAGTKVWLSKDGSKTKDISEIMADEKVVSFDRPGSALVGNKAVLETGCRRYTGRLLGIKAGRFETDATANHRFIVRWTDAARSGKACATYLMERGGLWRVGWCQLFNSEGAFHFNIRMNNERADRGWLLAVHKDRTDASVHESILAARYGLPTATFEPVEGANHLTSEAIQAIFDGIGDRTEQAIRCLQDYGRDPAFAFVDKVSFPGRHRTTVFETQACNLIPSLMAVPAVRDGGFVWEPVSVSERAVADLPVYSLKVEDHETYVADGIVTHNSIYKFSGASAELFLERAARVPSRNQLQLRQTRRFGQNIVDFSGKIIRRVAHRRSKEIIGASGKEGVIGLSGEFKPIHGDYLVLHRHVKGCQELAQAYIYAGIPFRNERGKDPLGAPNRLRAWMVLDDLAKGRTVSTGQAQLLIEELMPSVARGEHDEKVRLIVHGAKSKMEAMPKGGMLLEDLIRAKVLTQEGAAVIMQREYHTLKYPADLDYYDRTAKNGYELDPNGKIAHIVTIHGSKGREAADGVVVFNEMGMRCWDDPDTEHRLAYVASTRTKSDLIICAENKVEWARTEYNYPVEDGRNVWDGGAGIPGCNPQGQILGP